MNMGMRIKQLEDLIELLKTLPDAEAKPEVPAVDGAAPALEKPEMGAVDSMTELSQEDSAEDKEKLAKLKGI